MEGARKMQKVKNQKDGEHTYPDKISVKKIYLQPAVIHNSTTSDFPDFLLHLSQYWLYLP